MSELLPFAFSGINLIPTVLLMFTVAYWLIVILGVVDLDSIDVDIDGGVELDGLASVLSFFNIGQMPLMIFITFFSIPLWMVTLLATDLFGFNAILPNILIFVLTSVLCLFIAKFLTTPIAKLYLKIRRETEAIENIIGQVCTAKLPITSGKKGQAELKVNGTSILIYAKTREGLRIDKNESALIIDFVKDQNYYYVEPYQTK